MNDLTLGFIIGSVVQLSFITVILLRNEFRERRERREREKIRKMLKSAIPTSSTYSSNQ
jgi:peptidoglycan biosynthesis protein MviN/MurJ (putative lipid II flippase)